MTAPITPSRKRPRRSWPNSPTHTSTSTTPPRIRVPTSPTSAGATRPTDHSAPRASPRTPTPTSADHPPSWTTSAASCAITVCAPSGSIRNSSVLSPPSTPASHPPPRSGRTNHPVLQAPALSSPSPAAASLLRGHRLTHPSSTSPKRATSPPAGRAAPASATPAPPTSSQATSPTPPHPTPRAQHHPRLLQPTGHRSRSRPLIGVNGPSPGNAASVDAPSKNTTERWRRRECFGVRALRVEWVCPRPGGGAYRIS